MQNFITRHAIFDRKIKVNAYELAFRSKLDALVQKAPNADQKVSKILTDGVLALGLDKLTGGKRAFITFTRNLLLSEFAKMFPSEQIAVQIGAGHKMDAKFINAVSDLKESGYTIVLDDYAFQTDYMHLIPLCSMVKVDAKKVGDFIRKTIVTKLQPQGIKCLVKNVDTQAAYYKSFPMGYEFFQGDFFCKPAIVEKKDVPVSKINFMRMLKEINKPDMDFDTIETIIKQDVSLTYKLLRMINSSAFGIKNEVKSIKQALVLLGPGEVKKWITLVILSNMGDDKPDELMKKALVRAKFLEGLAFMAGMEQESSDLFLMGIFSLMDAMMGQTTETIMEGLPLSVDIKNTLLGKDSRYQLPFQLILAYEKGDWNVVAEQAGQMKTPEEKLPELFKQVIEWVNSVAI